MIEYRPIRSVFFRKTEFDIIIVSTFFRINLLPDARLNRILLLRMNQIPKSLIRICKKLIAMIKSKELLPLTGYIHGGCSPLGMKKQFRTFFHQTANDFETIMFSAGKIGYQVEVSPEALRKILKYETCDLVKE